MPEYIKDDPMALTKFHTRRPHVSCTVLAGKTVRNDIFSALLLCRLLALSELEKDPARQLPKRAFGALMKLRVQ